ncbi:MAG: methanogenesis marker 15 protein [Candidatus Bathyarchaeota archaeon]
MSVRVAQISCGTEYSGIQKEIEEAAKLVDMQLIIPDISLDDVLKVESYFGFSPSSNGLKVALARTKSLIEGNYNIDGVIVLTCFRCAEGSIIRSIIRKSLQQNLRIPILSYSFTERTKSGTLFLRMEALSNMIRYRTILARKKHKGLTVGVDSGSTMTKGVIMNDGEIVTHYWLPTTDILKSSEKVLDELFKKAGINLSKVDSIGVTGYGRFLLKKAFNADIALEEVTVCAKGSTYLAGRQEGEALTIDLGGTDNKAITTFDGIPDGFSVGGICAGASGKFLEVVASRLGVNVETLGKLALDGDFYKISMNAYCIVFGIQDLASALAAGARREDVAAAACYSVAKQFFEQQLQEVDIREPVIQVGGTSLIEGLTKAFEDILKVKVIVPNYSHYAGAVGAAVLASSVKEMSTR